MSPKLDAALVRDFPRLYADRHRSMTETAMCWGFQCGDGWEPIIRRLSGRLEAMRLPWWKRIYRTAAWAAQNLYWRHPFWHLALIWQGTGGPIASTVKEKYGSLRFYIHGGSDEALTVIDEAEKESARTCERCGAPGRLRDKRGWWATLCDGCVGRW